MFGLFLIGLYVILLSPPVGACICTFAVTAAILRPAFHQHNNTHNIN